MTILVRELRAEIERLQAEIKRLGGVRPDFPPRPPDGDGLPRYGIRWNGPQDPLTVPMEDGYWTPWHLAARHNEPAWVACSDRLPQVAEFDQQEFIVTVQRKGKVITMSALYLNAYPLYCEDHDDADDEGYVPHTGWYDSKSNGDDANCYSLINDSWYGSEVTHWAPMPAPAPAIGSSDEPHSHEAPEAPCPR